MKASYSATARGQSLAAKTLSALSIEPLERVEFSPLGGREAGFLPPLRSGGEPGHECRQQGDQRGMLHGAKHRAATGGGTDRRRTVACRRKTRAGDDNSGRHHRPPRFWPKTEIGFVRMGGKRRWGSGPNAKSEYNLRRKGGEKVVASPAIVPQPGTDSKAAGGDRRPRTPAERPVAFAGGRA